MKKEYRAVVTINQSPIFDNPRNVIFDFGEDLYVAREFLQKAEDALERYGATFELNYREEVVFKHED